MKIKEIELNNFRIYNGKNTVDLTTSDEHNIVIVSGDNGFGKTTFLMSIVWCLYGKQMEQVDELYKQEINSKRGGYTGYMNSCLNKSAASKGGTKFSVALTLTGLDLPKDLKCNEVKITRSYDTKDASGDDLIILFDGKPKEGLYPADSKEDRIEAEEFFIRERIMPIEIAKFFFFDAERIVAYAKMDVAEQQRNLADAYSQVLGIQKYESLKDSLVAIKEEYRKRGINSNERDEFNKLVLDIENEDSDLHELSRKITELQNEIQNKRNESSTLQERLLLEGNTMSQAQLEQFRKSQRTCKEKMDSAQNGLKDLYNYIPFGLSGELFAQLVEQVKKEAEYRQKKVQIDIAEDRTNDLLNDLDEESRVVDFPIDRKIRRFYEDAVKKLLKKHFYNSCSEEDFTEFEELHGLTEVQSNTLISFVSKIKGAQNDFIALYNTYCSARRDNQSIEQKIRDAESRSESSFIKGLKEQKEHIDLCIDRLSNDLIEAKGCQKSKTNELVAHKKQKEQLANRIEVSEKFKEKDSVMTDMIQSIDAFLLRFKEEKKLSLQKKILSNLQKLLHKKNLVDDVQVFIMPNMVDITLKDADGNKQDVADLSNGEKQMFSTALLSALVEETGIEFPVFIDSPLQKFDRSHSRNILEVFYPNISKQVVIFPLLHKELTETEYQLIKDKTENAFLIKNETDGSRFIPINKEDLFKE